MAMFNRGLHFEVLSVDAQDMAAFEPILSTLRESAALMRQQQQQQQQPVSSTGTATTTTTTTKDNQPLQQATKKSAATRSRAVSLHKHSLAVDRVKTKTLFFEATGMLNDEMQQALARILERSPCHDGKARVCRRALANHYETSLKTSSKDFKPSMAPHRDDVGEADLSVVLGISPRAQFRGARLFVSNVRDGRVWYDREGVPSRRSVVGLEVIEGTCVVLRNKVEHYVSVLQEGSRGSLVFHMTATATATATAMATATATAATSSSTAPKPSASSTAVQED